MKSYLIKKIANKIYEIGVFEESSTPISIYKIKNKACNCPGYYRQKNKPEHKHCKLIVFWEKFLNNGNVYELFFDGDTIKYDKIINVEWFKKKIKKLL